jgi:uncharacterized protein YecE (DUF72 family)
MVEVDSTFYRPPSLKMVAAWEAKTPADFRFSLKAPQVITHERILVNCQEETEAFVAAVRLLGPKLLCVTLQFGYVNQDVMPSQSAFLERLDPFLAKWPKDVALAVEVRNKWWMNDTLGACLRRHGVVWVLPEQAWMPHPLEVVARLDAVTGPFAYVRLLGDRQAVDDLTPTLDHVVIDRTEEMRKTAQAITRLARRVPVVTFVNNHYAGYGIATARQLRALVDEAMVGDVPPW